MKINYLCLDELYLRKLQFAITHKDKVIPVQAVDTLRVARGRRSHIF
jgi:hypothetical protein